MEFVALAVVIGVSLWTYLKMPRIPKVTQKPGDIECPICEDGAPIPVVFGTTCIKGANVTWWGGVETKEAEDKNGIKKLVYYISMHMGLCHGKLDGILKILVAQRILQKAPIYSDGRFKVDNGVNFFGGYDAGGDLGSEGTFYAKMGARNTTFSASPGVYTNAALVNGVAIGLGPGYFGVACVELERVDYGMTPFLQPMSFIVQRINWRNSTPPLSGHAAQWYPEKSIIPHGVTGETKWQIETDSSEDVPSGNMNTWYQNNIPSSAEDWSTLGHFMPFGEGDAAPEGLPSVVTEGVTNLWPAASHIWAKTTIHTDPTDFKLLQKIYLFVYCENAAWVWIDDQYVGTTNATNAAVNGSSANFDVTDVLRTSGSHTIVIYGIDEDETPDTTYLYARVVSSPIVDNNVDAATLYSYNDMNPAHIIRECLTDSVWGMGYLDADIDDTTFTAAADTLYQERFGISIQWNKPGSIEDFINEISRHINGTLYLDTATGKYNLTLVRDGYDTNSLLSLDEYDVERVEDTSRRATGDLVNQVIVSYTASMNGDEAAVTVTEPGLVQLQGAVVSHKIDYPGITTHDLASRVALRDLRVLSSPSLSCTVIASRKAASLNPGDAFLLTWPEFGPDPMAMRVASIELGDGKTNRVRIKCTEDVFGNVEHKVTNPGVETWDNPTATPTATPDPVVEDNYQYASTFMPSKITDRALKQSVDTVFCLSITGPAAVIFNQNFPDVWEEIRPGVWRANQPGEAIPSAYTNGVRPFAGMRVIAAWLGESVDSGNVGLAAEDKPRTGIYVFTDPGYRFDEQTFQYTSTYAQIERSPDFTSGAQLENGCVVSISGGEYTAGGGTLSYAGKYARLTTSAPITVGSTALEWELLSSYSAVRGDNLLSDAQTRTYGDAIGDTINLSATTGDPSPWVTFATLDGSPNSQTYPAGRTRWKIWCYFASGDQSATTIIKCRMVKYVSLESVTVIAEADTDPIVGGDEIFLGEYKTHDDVDTDFTLAGAKIAVQYQLTTTSASQVVVRLRYGDNLYVTRVDTPLVIGATQGGFGHTPYSPVIALDANGILTIPDLAECSGEVRVSGTDFKGISIADARGNGFVGGDKLNLRITTNCYVHHNETVAAGAAGLNLSTSGGLTGTDADKNMGPRSQITLQYDDLVGQWEVVGTPIVMDIV